MKYNSFKFHALRKENFLLHSVSNLFISGSE